MRHIGLGITMAMLGGLVAQTPLTLLTTALGWRKAILIDGALGLLILFLIAIVVRDYPAHYQEEHYSSRIQLSDFGYLKSMHLAYLKLQNWLCGIYTCLMNLPIFILGGFFR